MLDGQLAGRRRSMVTTVMSSDWPKSPAVFVMAVAVLTEMAWARSETEEFAALVAGFDDSIGIEGETAAGLER